MEKPLTHKRPRFSRGQEAPGDSPDKGVEPNFARGQAQITTIGRVHKGEFSTGQEQQPHHPEWEYEGRFSRGQESHVQRGSHTRVG
jgi:hypothetical protein